MAEHLYVQKTKGPDGAEVFYPISAHRIPTYWAFEKRAERLIRELRLKPIKEGKKDGKEYEPRRGYDNDIAPRGADVYDIDATPFNKESVVYLEGDIPVNAGKPCVLVVHDRGTGKAMGWHCYTGHENWEEGYRLAIFCALTSKARQLAWLQIDAPSAWPDEENIKCMAIFSDNGPGKSKNARAAYDRLDIRFWAAASETPQQKGGMEAALGRAQDAQASDGGGYRRTTRDRDRADRRLAKLMACDTQYEIERKLVESLIEENSENKRSDLLTQEMRIAGVRGSSNEMFSWWVKKMGGSGTRRLSEAEVYQALLNHKNCQVSQTGTIRLNRAYYTSTELRRHAANAPNVNVKVLFHPSRADEAYWITPDGRVDLLERERAAMSRYGHWSTEEIAIWEKADAAREILEKVGAPKKKKGGLTRRQAAVVLQDGGKKPKKQRTAPTPNVEDVRTWQLATERENRPIDKPELHTPALVESPRVVALKASEVKKEVCPPATVSAAPPGLGESGAAQAAESQRIQSADRWLEGLDED